MSLEQTLLAAQALIGESRYAEALEILAGKASENAEAAMLSGVAANRNGDLAAAVVHFEIAEKLAPELAAAPLNLGLTLRALNKTGPASLALTRALRLDPRAAAGNFALGNIRMEQAHFEGAIAHFEAVLQEAPDYVGALNNLGICWTKQKHPAKAVPYLEKAISLDPNNSGALTNLGAIKAEQGFTDDAIGLYERALQAQPDQAEAANNLGVALLDKGRAGEAAAVLSQLIDAGSAVTETYANLGNALNKLGDTVGAAGAYEAALSRRSDDGVRIKQALLLPVVAASLAALKGARGDLEARLEELIDSSPKLRETVRVK